MSEHNQKVAEVYADNAGNVSETARKLGITRATVRQHLRKAGVNKPLVAGTKRVTKAVSTELPTGPAIKRYLLTSAQNNTHIHDEAWMNLMALAKYYMAEVFVGTFSYNQNAYGEMAVKRNTNKKERVLWYDERVMPYVKDSRVELGAGLEWCGEMNILPTAEDPLSGLATYTHRKSSIFPHAKLEMRSVPTMKGEGTKLMYTTGTVTQRNYIQKKSGQKAEIHHLYSCLLVEVNSAGNWWVRQIQLCDKGRAQDLNVVVEKGEVTEKNASVEAITWGDLHATIVDESVLAQSFQMLDQLKPKYQFLHDVLEGVSINHHEAKNPHAKFKAYLRGYHNVGQELLDTAYTVEQFLRGDCQTLVVDSNHDNWLARWLREHDYRKDPVNAELFLELQKEYYRQLAETDSPSIFEFTMNKFGKFESVKFLVTDESFTICGKKIECGMHGHLGPSGSRGTPSNLKDIGRRANTAHTHSAGIYHGLYVAGTSSKLNWSYAKGPSSWSHSHIVTYPNGARSVITVYGGKWRA